MYMARRLTAVRDTVVPKKHALILVTEERTEEVGVRVDGRRRPVEADGVVRVPSAIRQTIVLPRAKTDQMVSETG